MGDDKKLFRASAQAELDDIIANDHKVRVTANIRLLEAIQAGNDPAVLKGDMDWDIMTPQDMTGIAMGTPDLWQEVPMKAILEGTSFSRGDIKGRLYQGKQTDAYYVKGYFGDDEVEKWWKLKKGTAWQDKNNWYTSPEVQTQSWDAWNGGQLNRTQY